MAKLHMLAVSALLGCTLCTAACTPTCARALKAATPVLSSGDPARGKELYAQCLACHSPERHRTGPKHCGLVGRKAGTAAGYEYSKAMQQADFVWTARTLDKFLAAPLDFVPGTNMGIAGIKKAADRRDLIAYLVAINGQGECE